MSKFTGVCEVVTMDLNGFNKNILSKEESWIRQKQVGIVALRPTFCGSGLYIFHNGHTDTPRADAGIESRSPGWREWTLLECFSGVTTFLMIVINMISIAINKAKCSRINLFPTFLSPQYGCDTCILYTIFKRKFAKWSEARHVCRGVMEKPLHMGCWLFTGYLPRGRFCLHCNLKKKCLMLLSCNIPWHPSSKKYFPSTSYSCWAHFLPTVKLTECPMGGFSRPLTGELAKGSMAPGTSWNSLSPTCRFGREPTRKCWGNGRARIIKTEIWDLRSLKCLGNQGDSS